MKNLSPKEKQKVKIKQLESYGWKIKGEYKNLETPTTVICRNGHETTLKLKTWNKLSEEKKSVCYVCENKKHHINMLTELERLQLKEVVDFPGYMISSHGYVYNKNGKQIGDPEGTKNATVLLRRDNKNHHFMIKELVAKHFLPTPDEFHQKIAHKDNDASNNKASNLEWVVGYSDIKYSDLINKEIKGFKVKEIVWSCRIPTAKSPSITQALLLCECRCGKSITVLKAVLLSEDHSAFKCICNYRYFERTAAYENEVRTKTEIMLNKIGWKLSEDFDGRNKFNKIVCPLGHEQKVRLSAWFDEDKKECVVCNGGEKPKRKYNRKAERLSKNRLTLLYYVKFYTDRGILYKIGVTHKSIELRFKCEKTPYKKIWEKRFDDGTIAYREERRLLNKYNSYKYTGKPILNSGGNTELFTIDVLGLDSKVEIPTSA